MKYRPTTAAVIAGLLAAGIAPLACAQTASVTLFGIVDAYAGRFTGAPTGVSAADKSVNKVDAGGMSTSRFGMRGSESLGGGLNAVFELSAFFRNDTGAIGRNDAIGAPVNVAADPFFSRAAWVGLQSNDWGQIRLGNATTLLFINAITSNAFGDSTVFSPLNLVTFVGGPLTGGGSWTDSIIYNSPNWAGLTLSAANSLSENRGGGNTALRGAYSAGPLAVSAAWQRVDKNPLTFADGTSPNNTRAWQLAASYNFQVVKVYGHLGEIQNRGTETSPLNVKYRIYEASAELPLGPGNVLVGYAQRKTGDAVGPVPATAAGGNKSRKVFTIGYDYALSKRTDAYVMLMRDDTITNVVPAPGTLTSAKANNFAVGIRHVF